MSTVCGQKKAVLMVISRCNAKCAHCYINYDAERGPKDTLEKVITLQDQGYKVVIAGSETLLEPEYLKAYKRAGQTYLLTNGILLKQRPELYKMIQQHGITQLTFSIHFGLEGDLHSIPEWFVSERIKEAKQKGFKVQVTTVVVPENADSVIAMCEHSVEWGVDILQFNRCVPGGQGKDTGEHALSAEEIQGFFDQITEARKRFSKDQLEIRPHGSFGPRPSSKGCLLASENRYCLAGRELFAIDPKGVVCGCPFIMREEAVIGHYTNGQIVLVRGLLENERHACIAHLLSDKKDKK